MTNLASVRDHLARLVSFDTVSRVSNLALIDWVEDTLRPLGAQLTRVPNADGTKTNLWVRIGPDAPGGIVLSGHTDVVPVDGQPWDTDPFALTEKDGKLYGRGTCDMKGFVAFCLAYAPAFAAAKLQKPVHFALSYDEEIGCQGAPSMIAEIVASGAAPEAVWVGEPSLWKVVSGHKGIVDVEVEIIGREGHSSLPDNGVSAIGEAVGLMALLQEIAAREREFAPEGSLFEPPYATLTIGQIEGGTASNILARRCRFVFDLRCPPGRDPDAVLAPFEAAVAELDARIKTRAPEGAVRMRRNCNVPPLGRVPDSAAEHLLRSLTGDNAVRAVAYAAEAGQFHQAGIPTVICGPGSIEQAHKPNEFVALSELSRGVEIFDGLVRRLS